MEPYRFAETTLDTALGGLVHVCQPARGFRFSVDAVLLARFASVSPVEEAVELGCGCGVVGLSLLKLGACRRLRGVDVQAAFIDLARRGAELNALSGNAFFEVCDVREALERLGKASAQLVVMNPPYRAPSTSRVSPDISLAIAKFEICGELSGFTRCAADVLIEGGELCVVYPASRLENLMDNLVRSGLRPSRIRRIHPRSGQPASLVLLGAVKGGVGEMIAGPPLFLHDEPGSGRKYSEEAAILLGCSGA